MNNELSHHGIKGMKWGIRRYQNSDGSLTPEGMLRYHRTTGKKLNKAERELQKKYNEAPGSNSYQKRQNVRSEKLFQDADRTDLTVERTIPKGTTFYRTTTTPTESNSGDRYMSYLEVDRNLYKGGAVRFQVNSKDAYETQYTLNKDLKIPSRERQMQAIERVCKDNSRTYNKAAEMIVKSQSVYFFDTRAEYDAWIKKSPQYKKQVEEVVDSFKDRSLSDMMYVSAATFGVDAKIRRDVIAELKKEGYNAMSDLAGVGGRGGQTREGYDPLIVFDVKSMTKGKTTKITPKEELDAATKYENWSWRSGRSLGAMYDEKYRRKYEAKWSDI